MFGAQAQEQKRVKGAEEEGKVISQGLGLTPREREDSN